MNKIQAVLLASVLIIFCTLSSESANAQWVKTNSFVSPTANLAYPHPSAAYGSRNGGGELFKSVDSGVNWQLVHDFGVFTTTTNVFFLNADTGFVEQINQRHRTLDGGLTWQVLPTIFAPAFLQNFFHTLKNIGDTLYISAARGDTSFVFQSVDYGATFNLIHQHIESSANPLYVSFYTAVDAYAIHPGNDSTLFITHDNFVSLDTLPYINAYLGTERIMNFVDSNHGFFYGNRGANSRPTSLQRLSNNSIRMDLNNLDATGILPAIDMELRLQKINGRVYACSEYGKVFWSNSFGNNWIEQATPVNTTVRSIAFANENLGIALSDQGAMYTRNGGDFPNSIINQELHDAIRIYPNPAQDNIFFEFEQGHNIKKVSILNSNGQQVLQSSQIEKSIAINSLARGQYQIIFEDKNGKRAVKRFIKR